MNNTGRLAYWRAKAKLTQALFYEQVKDPNKQDLAIRNLERFIRANREVDKLTSGQDYGWIYGE